MLSLVVPDEQDCDHMSASSTSVHIPTTQHILKPLWDQGQDAHAFSRFSSLNKKIKKIQPGSDQGIHFLVQRRPLLICSSVVNCLSMSGWVSTITCWFGASREDPAGAKEEPPPCYFFNYFCYFLLPQGHWEPGSLAMSHSEITHPPMSSTAPATWWREGSATPPGAFPQPFTVHLSSPSDKTQMGTISIWQPCQVLILPIFSALALLETATEQFPSLKWAPVNLPAVQIPWQRSNPPPHLLLRHL